MAVLAGRQALQAMIRRARSTHGSGWVEACSRPWSAWSPPCVASCSSSTSPASSSASSAGTSIASASGAAWPAEGAPAIGWLSQTIKEHPKVKKRADSYWTRKGPDGKPLPPMPFREKLLYGIGAAGFALAMLPRVVDYFKKKEDPEQIAKRLAAAEALQRKREKGIFMMVTGKNFLDEDAKSFEGMSPKEINALAMMKCKGKHLTDDPFDGLSPEEIDAMLNEEEEEQLAESMA